MHRIDGPGATIDGLFTEGDPSNGVPATTVTGAWLNAVQEEVANAVEAAGLVLDKPDNTQLAEAIYIIAGSAAGWTTGDVKLTMKDAADSGWLLMDDGTIGATGSAGTSRADDDCRALFLLLWNGVADAFAPVPGGRGASAMGDWDAGKTITLTRMLGRSLAIAGAGTGLSARELGQYVGAEAHTLTEAEIPLHGHPYRVSTTGSDATESSGGIALDSATPANRSAFTGTPTNSNSQTIGGTGGDAPHNNMQPTVFLRAMIKL